MNVEPLELRIAPATLTGQILTYTDIDGDKVAITISKGALAAGMFTFGTGSVNGDNSVAQQLRIVNVSGAAGIDGANLTMRVTKAGGGDGRAAVGRISSGPHDLGSVTIKGDLGAIDCGDGDALTGPALKLLSVASLGLYGETTQPAAGSNLISVIEGSAGAIKVAGDFVDAIILVQNAGDDPDGKIGSLFIGGSLLGGRALEGLVSTTGDIGSVTIKRHLVGGEGAVSGKIDVRGNLGPVTIAGNVIGGAGEDSGQIESAGTIGAVKIGGSVVGGGGTESGRIFSTGTMGDVKISGLVVGGAGTFSGQVRSTGAMGDVRIGGDLTGSVGGESGQVHSNGAMGDVRIGGDLIGGRGAASGQVSSSVAMGDVRIGGDLTGGAGSSSGKVSSGAMGDVRIGGDFTGGAAIESGLIESAGPMGDVRIGGNLIGMGIESGLVSSSGDMGHVRIGGDLIGGSITGSSSIQDSGGILCRGRLASVTIVGSLIAGSAANGGTLTRCGAITAGDDLGPVKIGGSIVGNSTNPALIIARGQEGSPTTGFDIAIASLTVGGDVRFAKILAGFDIFQDPANADAAIGAVKVGRDWVASSLVAGATNRGADDAVGGTGVNADDVNFGDGHDVLQSGGSLALIARIASITIKGDAAGSLATSDHFGFVAQQIDQLKIGTRTFTLAPGPSSPADNILLPFTDDVRLLEV